MTANTEQDWNNTMVRFPFCYLSDTDEQVWVWKSKLDACSALGMHGRLHRGKH